MLPDSLPLAGLSDVRWLDALGFALVVYFLVLGTMRGLWWQVVRLLGIVASIAVARALAPRLAPRMHEVFPDLTERLASGIVWTLILALGLLVVALVGRIGKDTIEAAQLGAIDRIGGGVAGLLTGVLVHAALVLCLCQTTDREWSLATVRDTQSQRLVDAVGRRIPLFLDAQAAETLEPWLREAR